MITPRKIVVLEGYRVLHALQGLYAIELVLRELPSLLIPDGLVWDMNGSKVARELRSSSIGEYMPMLFLASCWTRKCRKVATKKRRSDWKEWISRL